MSKSGNFAIILKQIISIEEIVINQSMQVLNLVVAGTLMFPVYFVHKTLLSKTEI